MEKILSADEKGFCMDMNTYDTVIFDLDGTLLDTLDDVADSVNTALMAEGFPPRSVDEVKSFVGNGFAKLIERAVPPDASVEKTAEVLAGFKRHYAGNCENKTKPYDGISELLSALQKQGYKTAVVSNKIDSAVVALCKKYFGSQITVSIGDREGTKRKPAPDGVFEAMHTLNSTPESCVYVGDSDVDILTAKNAGIPCISVSWGFRDRDFLLQSGARFLADKPSDIMVFLTKSLDF